MKMALMKSQMDGISQQLTLISSTPLYSTMQSQPHYDFSPATTPNSYAKTPPVRSRKRSIPTDDPVEHLKLEQLTNKVNELTAVITHQQRFPMQGFFDDSNNIM